MLVKTCRSPIRSQGHLSWDVVYNKWKIATLVVFLIRAAWQSSGLRWSVRHFSALKIKRGKTLYAYKLPLPECKAEVRTRLTKASPVAPDPDVGAELARRRNDTIFIVQGAVFRHDRLPLIFLSYFSL